MSLSSDVLYWQNTTLKIKDHDNDIDKQNDSTIDDSTINDSITRIFFTLILLSI